MNKIMESIKLELKKQLEKWQWEYFIATGIKPNLLVSDFGSRLEVQIPDNIEREDPHEEE